jgi:hypothetical protein
MTLAWGAKARGGRRHPGPIFFKPLMVKGIFCPLTGRAAFLFRGNVTITTPSKRSKLRGLWPLEINQRDKAYSRFLIDQNLI